MARSNAQLTRRVVSALAVRGDETVVEFGPGPGVGLRLLAEALPRGRVIGVEPSSVMRAQATARTRRFADRVALVDATAATIALPPGSVDAVCAVNNVQLWQPLPACLLRVFRLVRPGGAVVFGITEHAVLPEGGSAGRHFETRLLPYLTDAGFADLVATWEPGGNGQELLITGRRPGR
jgi:ubiquinone/menaquinone biosynthesis C-methylase UbiE